MAYLAFIVVSATLLLNGVSAEDVSYINRLLRPVKLPAASQEWVPQNQRQNQPQSPAQNQQGQQGQSVPVSPSIMNPPISTSESQPVPLPVKDKDSRLSPETRLELIRYVSGEFARAKSSLPAGKKGLKVHVGQPVDRKALLKALEDNGAAVNPGDNVQITKLEFGGSEIVVEINGGGDGGRSWRDRIQISGVGGGMPVSTSTTVSEYGAVAATVNPGITLQLDFGRPLPEMTPDELKLYLGSVLDFSKQRSAAVQWTESLPPEIREAIAQKRAQVGMDEDQVLAALGRPERKVRERQPDGVETEDWIYGQPPGKTIFVRFAHDKVIGISQYP